MPLIITGNRVPGATTQALAPGNVQYPSLAFANAQSTGLFLSAANVLGVSTGNVQTATFGANGLTVAPYGTQRFAANATTVLANLPFVSASSLGAAPLLTPAYELSITDLPNQVNGMSIVAWNSATGVPVNGASPILKTFSSEPTDKYVSLVGNANVSGTYFTLGQTTWNVATNSGFTCIARVRFATANVALNQNECILDFGNTPNADNIIIRRNGTEANVTFEVPGPDENITVTTPTPVITGNFQTIACRLIRTQDAPEIWAATIFNNGANVATTSTAPGKNSQVDKTYAYSYVGSPNAPSSSACYSTLDIQTIQLYDYPLSDIEITSMTTYLGTKFAGLFSTIANPAGGGVTIDAGTGTPLAVSGSNDVSGIRSVNGLVMRGLRPWTAPNLMRLDILNILRSSRDAWYPASSQLDAVRVVIGNFPGNYGFFGAVLMTDRRVFMVPYNATAARIYDPMADTVIAPSGSYPGSGGFTGGVLLHDGRVMCIPASYGYGIVYTPWTDAVSTTTFLGGPSSFAGGVVLNDGRVLLVPSNASRPVIYDPVLNTKTNVGAGDAQIWELASGKYAGGVLLPDGRVYCVPYNATAPLLVDPMTNTTALSSVNTFPGSASYYGGVLLPDGRVFNVPHNETSARIYDPDTDSVTLVPGFPGSYACAGGCLLPCGRVACSPYGTARVYIYDPLTDIVSQAKGDVPTNNAHAGAVLLPDGRAFFPPCNGSQARCLNTSWASAPLPVSVLTSPFLNAL